MRRARRSWLVSRLGECYCLRGEGEVLIVDKAIIHLLRLLMFGIMGMVSEYVEVSAPSETF